MNNKHYIEEGIYINPNNKFNSDQNLYAGAEENQFSETDVSTNIVGKKLNIRKNDFTDKLFSQRNYEYLASRIVEVVVAYKEIEIDTPSLDNIRDICVEIYNTKYHNGDLSSDISDINKDIIKECVRQISINIDKHLRQENYKYELMNRPKSTMEKDKLNFYS